MLGIESIRALRRGTNFKPLFPPLAAVFLRSLAQSALIFRSYRMCTVIFQRNGAVFLLFLRSAHSRLGVT